MEDVAKHASELAKGPLQSLAELLKGMFQGVRKAMSSPAALEGPPPMALVVSGPRRQNLGLEIAHQLIVVGGMIFAMRMVMSYLDPYKEQREQAKKRAAILRQQLGTNIVLNEFEQLLATNVINPDRIDVSLDDVSGLDDIIREMDLKIMAPMMQPDLYKTTLWRGAKGVLLYGPPGTGKTMLAKALSKQSRCFFLNITASSIMSKWLGDANRLIKAIFTLADKLQPCIIFVDEVDALLGKRGLASEHEATLQAKTEFMQLWDGMESGRSRRVVVMGATNRPWMVDEAVLRRFSIQYELGLPNFEQRVKILHGYVLKHHEEVGELGGVSEELLFNRDCRYGQPSLDWIASQTEGFSGSDLMELCASAAQQCLAEYWLQHRESIMSASTSGRSVPTSYGNMRLLALEDFEEVLKEAKPSTARAEEYREASTGFPRSSSSGRASTSSALSHNKAAQMDAFGMVLSHTVGMQASTGFPRSSPSGGASTSSALSHNKAAQMDALKMVLQLVGAMQGGPAIATAVPAKAKAAAANGSANGVEANGGAVSGQSDGTDSSSWNGDGASNGRAPVS